MKKITGSLFFRVVIAIALGAVLGLFIPEVVVRIFKTFNVLFAQLLKFVIPLLVLGLVTPSIANLGKGAGKMVLFVLAASYISTITAGIFSFGAGSALLPHYLSVGELTPSALSEKVFKPFIELKIPPICDVMTAIVLAFVLGIGIIVTKADILRRGFEEFGTIIKITIEKVIIPCLPVYIFTMICEMSAKGVIDIVMGCGFKVIITGVLLSIAYLVVQYTIAGIIARKNPLKSLWNMIPAYLTGFSICSSSAVIPVTYKCALKNGVSEDIANFTVPLCATVHMCGSTIKLAVTAFAVAYMSGMDIPIALYINFVLVQGVAAVAAPGVMGGVLMASVGLLETILGFSPDQTALVMAIYLALDGYGPACNVAGDGAISLIADRIFGK